MSVVTKAQKPMRKFRLLAGCHSEGFNCPHCGKALPMLFKENTACPFCNETVKKGNPIVYRPGDVFLSPYDLDRKLNSPGSIKFEPLDGATPASTLADLSDEELTAEVARRKLVPQDEAPTMEEDMGDDTLTSMTAKELRQLAAQEEIDLGNANGKDQMIAVIRSARNAG